MPGIHSYSGEHNFTDGLYIRILIQESLKWIWTAKLENFDYYNTFYTPYKKVKTIIIDCCDIFLRKMSVARIIIILPRFGPILYKQTQWVQIYSIITISSNMSLKKIEPKRHNIKASRQLLLFNNRTAPIKLNSSIAKKKRTKAIIIKKINNQRQNSLKSQTKK